MHAIVTAVSWGLTRYPLSSVMVEWTTVPAYGFVVAGEMHGLLTSDGHTPAAGGFQETGSWVLPSRLALCMEGISWTNAVQSFLTSPVVRWSM